MNIQTNVKNQTGNLFRFIGIFKLQGHTGWVKAILCDEAASQIISGSGDKTIRIWDMNSMTPKMTLEGHRGGVTALQCDAKSIVSGSVDKTLKHWDRNTGACINTLRSHQSFVKTLEFIDYALATYVNVLVATNILSQWWW